MKKCALHLLRHLDPFFVNHAIYFHIVPLKDLIHSKINCLLYHFKVSQVLGDNHGTYLVSKGRDDDIVVMFGMGWVQFAFAFQCPAGFVSKVKRSNIGKNNNFSVITCRGHNVLCKI